MGKLTFGNRAEIPDRIHFHHHSEAENTRKNSILLSRKSNKLLQKKENRQGFFKKIKRRIHLQETILDLNQLRAELEWDRRSVYISSCSFITNSREWPEYSP